MNASVNAASAHHNTHYDRRFTGDGIDILWNESRHYKESTDKVKIIPHDV
jgi:hypothetical protein